MPIPPIYVLVICLLIELVLLSMCGGALVLYLKKRAAKEPPVYTYSSYGRAPPCPGSRLDLAQQSMRNARSAAIRGGTAHTPEQLADAIASVRTFLDQTEHHLRTQPSQPPSPTSN